MARQMSCSVTSTRPSVRSLRPRHRNASPAEAPGALRDRRHPSLRDRCRIVLWSEEHRALFHQLFGIQTRGHRLAVLPLTLVDSGADAGYLADGMTQELIAQLSRVGGLRVIARSSVMGYKRGSKSSTEKSGGNCRWRRFFMAAYTKRAASCRSRCISLTPRRRRSCGRSTTPHLPLNSKDSSTRSRYGSPKCSVCRSTGLNSVSWRGSAPRARRRTSFT